MVELYGFKQEYGDRLVLDIPMLQFRQGGRYALIGANGAGKTTLLRALSTRFKVRGNPAGLGYLPQKPYAFSMSVRQNIELGIPTAMPLSRNQKKERVDQQLAAFALEPLAHQRADRLSGGEAQKMALARLLVIPRRILLLDEPTNSMDIGSLQTASRAIRQYLDSNGCLMVLVSHQLALIRQLTDELLFLDQGRLVESGPTASLLDFPENEPLKRFLQFQLTEVP